jgi:3-oxoacyl-[acyl-carrier-protein] synthase III
LEPGQHLLTVAFGSGFSWAAGVLTCDTVPPVEAEW